VGLSLSNTYKCLLKVLSPVSRPITTLDCVPLKDNNRAHLARLGPENRHGLNEVFAFVLCLSRNVGDLQSTQHNIPKEPRSHIVRTFGYTLKWWCVPV
jgi:hypothetical protein